MKIVVSDFYIRIRVSSRLLNALCILFIPDFAPVLQDILAVGNPCRKVFLDVNGRASALVLWTRGLVATGNIPRCWIASFSRRESKKYGSRWSVLVDFVHR